MRITERLDVEHRMFVLQLDDVSELIRAGAAPAVWQAAAGTIARVVAVHVSLEEHLVFPALGEARPEWAGLLAELEREHRWMERLARAIPQDVSGAVTLEWIELLRQHVEKETFIAFPLAEESLPAARLRLTRVDLIAGVPVPRPCRGGEWPEHWLG